MGHPSVCCLVTTATANANANANANAKGMTMVDEMDVQNKRKRGTDLSSSCWDPDRSDDAVRNGRRR
jgi:hypothetical protein